VAFSVVIGLLMHLIYRREETDRAAAQAALPEPEAVRPLWQTALFFASMVAVLVFANWGRPQTESGMWWQIFAHKWAVTGVAALALVAILVRWFGLTLAHGAAIVAATAVAAIAAPHHPEVPFVVAVLGLSVVASRDDGELGAWFAASWGFAKQILPLLLGGVLVAGLLLGRPGQEGLIPSAWVTSLVGGNSLGANLFASVFGAFMYFATLTEVPILQGLLGSGMGKGPALALLLAGPALSLPSMLVLASIMGWRKTTVFVTLVVILSTITGLLFGAMVG
jgi:uncharacterized membrane protein YraQ (UPF0718 family)